MTLNEIGLKHATDKASAHHYLELYDLLFSKWRDKRVHLLEIGCQFGNSARMWCEYFPNGAICMIDVVDNGLKPDDYQLLIGNAYEDSMLKRLSPPYDILIEDGDHSLVSQEYFVANYLPMLRDGGIGVVEDVYSKNFIPTLQAALPKGFQCSTVQMSEGTVDSRLFICFRS